MYTARHKIGSIVTGKRNYQRKFAEHIQISRGINNLFVYDIFESFFFTPEPE